MTKTRNCRPRPSDGGKAGSNVPRIKAAKALVAARAAGIMQVGDPVIDWREARRLLNHIQALNELFREIRLVRLFRATDALASKFHL